MVKITFYEDAVESTGHADAAGDDDTDGVRVCAAVSLQLFSLYKMTGSRGLHQSGKMLFQIDGVSSHVIAFVKFSLQCIIQEYPGRVELNERKEKCPKKIELMGKVSVR